MTDRCLIPLCIAAAAMLTVWTAPASAALLSVDIDGRQSSDSAGNTQSGFDALDVVDGTDSPLSFTDGSSGVQMTIWAFDDGARITAADNNAFTARRRPVPNDSDGDSVPSGDTTVDFDEELLHQDWIQGGNEESPTVGGDGADDGLDILLENLTPNQSFTITIWSFEPGANDDGSTQGNAGSLSDWVANSTLVQDNWEVISIADFDEDSDGRFTFTATADALGELLIEARGGDWMGVTDAGTRERAFLNAIQVNVIPTPAALPAGLALMTLTLMRRRHRA